MLPLPDPLPWFVESDGEGDEEPERRSRKRKSSDGRGISPIQWDRNSEEEEEEKSDEDAGSEHGSKKSGDEEDDIKGGYLQLKMVGKNRISQTGQQIRSKIEFSKC